MVHPVAKLPHGSDGEDRATRLACMALNREVWTVRISGAAGMRSRAGWNRRTIRAMIIRAEHYSNVDLPHP
jgi:hypothetical protein